MRWWWRMMNHYSPPFVFPVFTTLFPNRALTLEGHSPLMSPVVTQVHLLDTGRCTPLMITKSTLSWLDRHSLALVCAFNCCPGFALLKAAVFFRFIEPMMPRTEQILQVLLFINASYHTLILSANPNLQSMIPLITQAVNSFFLARPY